MMNLNKTFKLPRLIKAMNRLDAYSDRQFNVSDEAKNKAVLARRIARNINETNSFSNRDLRLYNSYDRQVGPILGLREPYIYNSQDPVVNKLNSIDRSDMLHFSCHAGPIRQMIHSTYLADISWRRMTEEVYIDLLETSEADLVKRWIRQFEERLFSRSKSA